MSIARPFLAVYLHNATPAIVPCQAMLSQINMNAQLEELASVMADCETHCFTKPARDAALVKVNAIRDAIDVNGVPVWKRNTLMTLTGLAAERIGRISSEHVIKTLIIRQSDSAELEGILHAADNDDDLPDYLVEKVAVAVAKSHGIDIDRWRKAASSLFHKDLSTGYSDLCVSLSRFINTVPKWIIKTWDEQCAAKLYNEAARKAEVYSLKNIARKLWDIVMYLEMEDYSWEKEAAISSIAVWKALLDSGKGAPAELQAAATLLSELDVSDALLQQRRKLRLLVPVPGSKLSEEQLMRIMASDMLKVPNGVDERVWQLVMYESGLAAFRLSWEGYTDNPIEGVVSRMYSSRRTKVDLFLAELEEGNIAEMRAIRTMLRGALGGLKIAVAPRAIQNYAMVAAAHQHDLRFSELIEELRDVLDCRANIAKRLARIHSCEKMDEYLAMADLELSGSNNDYSPAVEANLGNLAVWKKRLMVEHPDYTIAQRALYYAAVKKLILKHQWAFLAQREELGLPLMTVNNEAIMDQVVRFVREELHRGFDLFTPRYYTTIEREEVGLVSIFVAVVAAICKRSDGMMFLDVYRYLEDTLDN